MKSNLLKMIVGIFMSTQLLFTQGVTTVDVNAFHLLSPMWQSDTCFDEAVVFVRDSIGGPSVAQLLFTPASVILLRNSAHTINYTEGIDYTVDALNKRLVLTPASKIKKVPRDSSISGEWNFQSVQMEVTYKHSDRWVGYKPAYAGNNLPITTSKLKSGQPVTYATMGNSISYGYSSSGLHNVSPFMPSYCYLLKAMLEKSTGSPITFYNHSISGTASSGKSDMAKLVAAENPDFVILAYGMNECGGDGKTYKANLKGIIDTIRKIKPNCEFIIETSSYPAEQAACYVGLPKMRDSVATMVGNGVVMDDLTQLWSDLLDYKRYWDLTGNGINHPDDWGQRLYAQSFMEILWPGDTTAPALSPTGLVAVANTTNGAFLQWNAVLSSSEPKSGIIGYTIFKNGINIGYTTETSYTVNYLKESTTYQFSVAAVNGKNLTGAPCTSINLTIPVDTAAPKLTNVSVTCIYPMKLLVRFSEMVEKASAEAISNYSLSSQTISAAVIQSDSASVLLTLTQNLPTGTYTLSVSSVRDRAVSIHTIKSGSSISFNYKAATGGLHYDNYETTPSSLSFVAFAKATPTTSGTVPNFTLSVSTKANLYALRFAGYIAIPVSGTYTFYTKTGDGSNLFIGTVKVVDNEGGHQIRERSGSIYLEAGFVPITLLYNLSWAIPGLEVYWQGPGISKQLIPAGMFSLNKPELTITTVALDTEAPSVPSGLVSSGIESTLFTLSWNPSTDNVGVAFYEVYKNGILAGNTASASITLTGLTASTIYSMTVKAKDAAGNISAASTSLNVTTIAAPDVLAPTSPAGLTVSALKSNGFTLSWTASTDNVGVVSYEVFRGATSCGTTSSSTLVITGLTASTVYAMTVKAKDAAGNISSASSILNVTTPSVTDTQSPTIPTNLSASLINENGFTLFWTASTDNVGVVSYEVFRGTTSCGTTTSATINITGLTAATEYTMTVKAKDAAGNVSAASQPLKVTTAEELKIETDQEVVEVYPNPVNDHLLIHSSVLLTNLELVDLSGRIVKMQSMYSEQLFISIAGLPNGIYILRCYSENGTVYLHKIIKE